MKNYLLGKKKTVKPFTMFRDISPRILKVMVEEKRRERCIVKL